MFGDALKMCGHTGMASRSQQMCYLGKQFRIHMMQQVVLVTASYFCLDE